MNHKLLFIFTGIFLICSAQTAKKPFPFTGTYTINYEQLTAAKTTSKGTILCAFNTFDAALIPSFANTIKDVAGAKLLVNTNLNEMTMLTSMKNGKKSGLLTTIPKPAIETAKTTKAPIITKTKETKVIQGYACEKIIITLADTTKIESWTTGAIVINIAQAIQITNSGFKGKSPLSAVNISSLNGTPLETVITYKNGTSVKLIVTDIKKIKPDAAFFSSSGFNIMDARGLPMFNGN